jgi:hypothetical protein
MAVSRGVSGQLALALALITVIAGQVHINGSRSSVANAWQKFSVSVSLVVAIYMMNTGLEGDRRHSNKK